MTSKAPAINPLVKPLIEGYQERMQKYKTEFETLQRLSKQCGTDYTMLAQKVHENELVLAEIRLLEDDQKIYKQVGPALIPQTKENALLDVNQRLELFKTQEKKKENELNENKKKMIKIQQDIQTVEGDFKHALNSILQDSQQGGSR